MIELVGSMNVVNSSDLLELPKETTLQETPRFLRCFARKKVCLATPPTSKGGYSLEIMRTLKAPAPLAGQVSEARKQIKDDFPVKKNSSSVSGLIMEKTLPLETRWTPRELPLSG